MLSGRYVVIAAVVIAGFTSSACRLEKEEPSASRDGRVTIPTEAPSITGVVTSVGPDGRIRIEERPGDTAGSAKAVVRLASDARIVNRSGSPATIADIQNGMRVSAWFSGPVMESYPVQATASAVVIESGTP